MNQSGRASLLTILAIAAVLLIGGLMLFARESLASVGDRFMQALAVGDVNKLTEMSYLGNDTKEQMHKKWDFAVNRAGRYYYFVYQVSGSKQISADSGQVTMKVLKDINNPGAYEQKFELPLVKVDDEWKVDVKGINRELYPALPR